MKTVFYILSHRLIFTLALSVMTCWGAQAWAYSLDKGDIKQMLIDEARQQELLPSLILAIAKVESDFNPQALSHAGAKGVMQIMPATAKKGFGVASHELYDARVNVQVGVAFIKQLLEQYDGRVDIALSHYNGGSAVNNGKGDFRVIPATRDYVNKVRQYARRYAMQGYDEQGLSRVEVLSYTQLMLLDEMADEETLTPWFVATQTSQTEQYAADTNSLYANNRHASKMPQIDNLQLLREHNLTRHVPVTIPALANPVEGIATMRQTHSNDKVESATHAFIRGPKIKQALTAVSLPSQAQSEPASMYENQYTGQYVRQTPSFVAQPQAPRKRVAYASEPNSAMQQKQQKVASWEAIFD